MAILDIDWENIDKLKRGDLQRLCKELNLPIKGTSKNTELLEALKQYRDLHQAEINNRNSKTNSQLEKEDQEADELQSNQNIDSGENETIEENVSNEPIITTNININKEKEESKTVQIEDQQNKSNNDTTDKMVVDEQPNQSQNIEPMEQEVSIKEKKSNKRKSSEYRKT
ncbi:hypothetical protein DLAC_05598 [Tieghemostelium lacteum]|uniref:Uncharacterized protein n=1 Tax=Tieghemostelium lacteum TaxID=361077 RepID=A0A151ZG97_TIELA|nr:hypothetical protein DLAC_05598 [Tieghemostelium lacteum]|eukprot:KYQ92996.1 hypothetical protein DLAC_05598 [Tieghemostelium lacteum]